MRSHYFRVSVTERCNLRCPFCHREGQAGDSRKELSGPDIVWAISIAHQAGFHKFKLTGGEPTLRQDLADIIEGCVSDGLDDLSLITNGTTLTKLASTLWNAGLRRLNVSLPTLDIQKAVAFGITPEAPRQICEGIDKALNAGFRNMKINFVYRGSDSETDFWSVAAFAAERGLTTVLLPVIADSSMGQQRQVISLQQLHSWLAPIANGQPSISTDREGIRRALYHLPDGISVMLRLDELGLLRPFRLCGNCQSNSNCKEGIFAIRLLANGTLRPCLASGCGLTNTTELIRMRDSEGFRRALISIFVL